MLTTMAGNTCSGVVSMPQRTQRYMHVGNWKISSSGNLGRGQLGRHMIAKTCLRRAPARASHGKHELLNHGKAGEPEASVGIIMGSDSDLRIMQHAAQVLDGFSVCFEMDLVSAHRTADWMFEYAKHAHTRGLKVVLAGAGGAAHLAGMLGSISPLGVIGVPINATPLLGIDSLLSIVQMPNGVPVASVPVDDANSAGMLAIRLLALSDERLRQRITLSKDDDGLERLGLDAEIASSLEGLARSSEGSPVVGIVAGSISDLQPAKDAAAALRSFGLQYEIVPASMEYANNAHAKGVKLMIVGTGVSALLPELVSKATPLPVIGIPTSRPTLSSTLDPLLVQKEAPVAWVGVENGMNAGLLAVRFLASMDASLLDKIKSSQQEMKSSVMSKAVKLRALGWSKYIEESLA